MICAISMRKANLARLVRGRPDGIFISEFEQDRTRPRSAREFGLEVWFRNTETAHIAVAVRSTGSRCYGAGRTARVCGTLGALSKDTKGAPHVATF